jgi:5,5'-dehydrodivanillate O-demethylase oxygenase subunit
MEMRPMRDSPQGHQIDHRSPDMYRSGPGTLAGRYMRQFWLPVALSEDVKPGEAKPLRIMSENFTLYRGESGQPHVVAQRCPHRGTQLSVGWVEGDNIRCRYHGWKFNGNGQCIEIPANFDEHASRIRIARCPAHDHVGLIFAYFGQGEPPVFPPFPAFADEGIVEPILERLGCNFLQGFENDWDEYHVGWTHRTGGLHTMPRMADQTFEEADYGVLKMSSKEDGTRRTTVFFPPTGLRIVAPTQSFFSYAGIGPAYRDTYIFHTPVDDENQLFFFTQHIPLSGDEAETYAKQYAEYRQRRQSMPTHEIGEEILAGRRRFQDAFDHPFLAALEDYLAQVGQGRIADRAAEHLSRTDVGIVFFRRLWARELGLIAAGKPTKSWTTLTEMPHADINQAVLKTNRGTGARTPAKAG